MRRIPLALALVGAVAVTGCMGGAKSSATNDSGVQKGVTGSYFYINVFTPPVGGIVESTPAGIKCGASALPVVGDQYAPTYYPGASNCGQMQVTWGVAPLVAEVSLKAIPQGSNVFIGWAGDCSGTDPNGCVVTQGADKTVVAIFGPPGSGHGMPFPGHGAVFGQSVSGDTAVPNRKACHGPDLKGLGMAPSCASCHASIDVSPSIGGHGDATAAPWGDHGSGWGAACQRCHTQDGFKDWLNVPGVGAGLFGYLDNPFTGAIDATATTPPGGAGYANGPMTCSTCHNPVSEPTGTGLTTIVFPSNKRVTTDKATALCGQCHGARESSSTIETRLAAALPLPHTDDSVLTGTGTGTSFMNPHYLGAAATMFGSEAAGWVQYPGKVYTARNQHGVIAGSCVSCHDPHGLGVSVTKTSCGRCHIDEVTGLPVANMAELEESRQFGFDAVDVDGDGTVESLKAEIEGLAAVVNERMQAYTNLVVKPAAAITYGICYQEAYPYFNQDTNSNGTCDATETTAFKMFTPRLMRAAVNLKWSHTESNAWAHNPRYAIEVLFDTIMDLDAAIVAASGTSINFQGFRSFEGHFGGVHTQTHLLPADHAGSDAFHDWDGSATIGSKCGQCHGGAKGITAYLGRADNSVAVTGIAPVTGFECTTCHAPAAGDTNFKTMRAVGTLYFPGQKAAGKFVAVAGSIFPKPGDAVCATCHAGRENRTSIQDKTCVGTPTCADVTTWTLGFTNPHYLGAAGILFGSDTHMMYEYGTKTYAGKPINWGSPHGSPHGGSCTGCHQPQASKHSFEVNLAYCSTCHVQVPNVGDYRLAPLKNNLTALASKLYVTIATYSQLAGNGVCYSAGAYPYWFLDNALGGGTANDGVCSATEAVSANATTFNAKALRAAFNYKWSQAEPGAYAHNYEYMAQALIDSILDLDPAATLPVDEKTGVTIVRP